LRRRAVDVSVHVFGPVDVSIDVDVAVDIHVDIAVVTAAAPDGHTVMAHVDAAAVPVAVVRDDRAHGHAHAEGDQRRDGVVYI
jgi:hypothetical protein